MTGLWISISLPLKIQWTPFTLELQCSLYPYEKNYQAQTSNLQSKIQFRFLKHIRTTIELVIRNKLSEADNFKIA